MKSQKSEYELLILGGGPAGLSVSFYAKKTNIPFQLIEASNHLGEIVLLLMIMVIITILALIDYMIKILKQQTI